VAEARSAFLGSPDGSGGAIDVVKNDGLVGYSRLKAITEDSCKADPATLYLERVWYILKKLDHLRYSVFMMVKRATFLIR
jgi:hypothetical protein